MEKIMGYQRRLGEIALCFLLAKIESDLPHFDKKDRERFFITDFTSLYKDYLEQHMWICPQLIPHFGSTLSYHAYDATSVDASANTLPPSSCFLWLCFVYVVCLSRRHQFDMSDEGFQKELALSSKLGVTEDELIHFFSEVSSHMWQTRLSVSIQSVQLIA